MSGTLERLANGCILAGFAGTTTPSWLERELDDGLAGVVLFGRNVSDPEQLQALTRSLRVSATTVVAIDEEGGDVTRLEATRGSSVPGPLALGTIDDVALTEQVGRAIAEELRVAGITLNLAPVADINTNPLNPVIGVRSFGSDPALVSRHVAAFVTGLQAGGVAACAKHFPGHGATDVDSHLDLPVVAATREQLLEIELAPFRSAIAAGARAIMSAHLVVPAIDSVPATLSHAQLTALLREELGFTGTTVTDALEMKAVSETVGMEEGAVLALLAGADALCLGHDIDEGHVARVRAAIVAAVRGGRLDESRVAEAAGRVAGSHVPVASDRVADAPSFAEIGLAAARRALVVRGTVGEPKPLLVIDLEGTTSVAAGPPSHDLASILGELGGDIEAIRITEQGLETALQAVQGSPGRRPIVVIRDVDRHPWQQRAAAAILAVGHDAVVVDVGYPAQAPPALNGRITTFGSGRASLTAAAELLLGAR
jgi:beta-N-acetylhexosaminidase